MKPSGIIYLLCIALALGITSCTQEKSPTDFETITLYPEHRFSGFSEEHFLASIISLDAWDDRLFLCNFRQSKVYISDLDYQLIKVINSTGKGPGDIYQPWDCFANENGFYLFDNNRRISHFSLNGEFKKIYKLTGPLFPIYGFWINGDTLLLSDHGDIKQKPIFRAKLDGTILNQFGHHEKVVNQINRESGNFYHMAQWKDLTVAICLPDPVIELYRSDSLIDKHSYADLKDIQHEIQEAQRYEQEHRLKGKPQPISTFFMDADVVNNYIYLLIGSYDESKGMSDHNMLLEFKIEKDRIQRRRILKLESGDNTALSYVRFAIHQHKIIAYNYKLEEIHRFSLK